MESKSTFKYKILYLTYHPQIGGGETMLLSLLSKLDKKLFKPTVIVTTRGQLYKKLKKEKIETYVVPLNGYLVKNFFIPGMSPYGIYKTYKIVKKVNPDLIHLNHLNLALYAGCAGKLQNIPVIATAHGPWDNYYFYQDFINRIFVNKILANTQKTANIFKKGALNKSKKVAVVHFGIDTNKFKPATKNQVFLARKALGLPQNGFIVTIVGRLDPIKDHITFLEAAEIIRKKIKNAYFFIVGSKKGDFSSFKNAYEKSVYRFLSKHPFLAKKVIFGGFIDEMPPVYHATDILVSSSKSESFGLSILEASACAVPTIATNVGNQKLIIKNGKTGYLVPPEKPLNIAKIIKKLDKKNHLKKLGKSARQQVLEHFRLEKYVQKVQKNYLQLAKSKTI